VVNPTGGVLEGQDYAPYGSPFGHTGTPQTVFGFTGEQTDASGLVYLRARYYVPGLGVFPSLDPVEEVSGHLYQYASADPINRTDPSGLIDWMSCAPIPDNPNLYSCYLPVPGWLEDSLQGVDLAYPELMDEILRINGVRRSGLSSNHINPQTPLNYQPRIGVGYYRHFAYDSDKFLLIPDSITASSMRLSNIIQRGRTSYLKSIIPKAPWTYIGNMSGYLEGVSYSWGTFYLDTAGEETVYNFATFQRMDFWHRGRGLTGSAGLSNTYYTGYIWGFTHNSSPSSSASHFANEYGGISVFGGAEGTTGLRNLPIGAALGTAYFRSLAGPVNGSLQYISGGAGWSLPLNLAISSATSYPKVETLKQYISPNTCKVDIGSLEADILTGTHTPLAPLGNIPRHLGREWGAKSARQIAETYNDSFANICGC